VKDALPGGNVVIACACLARKSDGYDTMRRLRGGAVLSAVLAIATPRCLSADLWGGSVNITSNYLVRGISRSNDHAALQLDLHYVDSSGFVVGSFVSNTQIDPDAPRDVELNEYLGLAWAASSDWRGKVLAAYYAYPWNSDGSHYNYAELDLDVTYQEWLDLSLSYSPSAPRFLRSGALVRVGAESAELNLQHTLLGKLSGTAGIGYYELGGPPPTGYAYWSVGAAYELAPVSLALSYVDTTATAKTLFYDSAAGGRWTGTVIWRF
jgi:uncharacterized protein (TIGR02001 family)